MVSQTCMQRHPGALCDTPLPCHVCDADNLHLCPSVCLSVQILPLQAQVASSKTLATGVQEVQDKVHAAHLRITRLISERVDLVKKGTPVQVSASHWISGSQIAQ